MLPVKALKYPPLQCTVVLLLYLHFGTRCWHTIENKIKNNGRTTTSIISLGVFGLMMWSVLDFTGRQTLHNVTVEELPFLMVTWFNWITDTRDGAFKGRRPVGRCYRGGAVFTPCRGFSERATLVKLNLCHVYFHFIVNCRRFLKRKPELEARRPIRRRLRWRWESPLLFTSVSGLDLFIKKHQQF